MSLYIRRTALLRHPGVGVVKITPRGGKSVRIDAPESVEITDKRGRPMERNRKKRQNLTDTK